MSRLLSGTIKSLWRRPPCGGDRPVEATALWRHQPSGKSASVKRSDPAGLQCSPVIRSFADRATEDVFDGATTRGARRRCPPAVWRVARRKLTQLNQVDELRHLAVPPGNRLERLRGDRAGQYSIRINDRYRVCLSGSEAMPMTSKSPTTTEAAAGRRGGGTQPARRLPRCQPPTHPGEMLLEEFLKPLGISQSAFAQRLGVSYSRLRGIVHAKGTVTADTALRLARVTGMTAEFWLGLQQDWDLWHAARSRNAAVIESLEPLPTSAAS